MSFTSSLNALRRWAESFMRNSPALKPKFKQALSLLGDDARENPYEGSRGSASEKEHYRKAESRWRQALAGNDLPSPGAVIMAVTQFALFIQGIIAGKATA
ncbi:hypothetical protein C3B44_05795 [Corynebacterium yudongzhengii]|uniref:Uncharacterized protein n=1 Tax=Corynebacterium yudongzhengii TaxID=2080740 RepID=A0A2U1T8V7_9CORY|nr:hypothetical protein [Corynebacterium yudongzhengii]AWB81926.1 hypothetical protein C3B44_05795 [Corynebacterium yudongzhengii]PWC02318.1 hypothetical protein DF222_03015 [Corynebacterium yudongzhengii]